MKKKHLAIICGVLYPEPSPTGLCTKRFAELLVDDFDIDMICISINGKSEDIRLNNGVKIHTLSGGVFGAECRSKGVIKKLLHQIGRVQIKSQMLGNLKWFEKAVLIELKKINKSERIDSLFSICSPFAAHVAAKDFKQSNPSVHWCAYTVDPYSTNNRIRPFNVSLSDIIEYERNVILGSDSLLLSEEVYRNRNDLYNEHRNCKSLPYMLPDDICAIMGKTSIFEAGRINCVYAGRFYEDIRNPEPMLKTFSQINKEKIVLHLFSAGCEEIVDKYADGKRIIKHGLISRDEIKKVYNNADFLLVVLNATDEFLPSKIFEYIVTKKPIIAFYTKRNSEELTKYPLSLQIKTDSGNFSNEDLIRFINEMHDKTIDDDQIETIYADHSRSNIYQKLITSVL